MFLFILSIMVALTVSFVCSVLEACLLSISMTDIADLSEKHPINAAIWRRFKDDIHKPIAVILIVNTLAHTIGAAVSGAQYNALFTSKWVGVYSLVFSLVMIQWTELLPKTMAVRYNRQLAPLVARPLQWAVNLFLPLVFLMEWINRPFQGSHAAVKPDALREISVLAKFASVNKLISREQEDIVARSIQLSKTRVRDIMVGRDEIKALSTSMSMMDALIESHIHHHTRYLLVDEGNLDKVVGYVNVKDIVSAMQINPKDPSLKGISRPVLMFKPADFVPAMLKQLTKGYQHMAVICDEAGRTAGMVTLEDVVEAIVGDIEDEYDVLPTYVYQIAENRFLAGGGVSLPVLREKTGFQVPDQPLPLNEWLLTLSKGRVAVEARIPFNDLVFIVHKTRRSMIHEVLIEQRKS